MQERRKHKRYRMPRGTFAILREDIQRLHDHENMGIGEIAMVLYKANPEMMSQVVDIGFGGVAVKAPAEEIMDTRGLQLDVLMAEQGIYVYDIPFAIIDHPGVSDDTSTDADSKLHAFRFGDLNAQQEDRLKRLMTQQAD
jgi:hypothetical protein